MWSPGLAFLRAVDATETDAFKVKGSAGLRGCRRRGRSDNYRLAAFTGTPGKPRKPAWTLVIQATE